MLVDYDEGSWPIERMPATLPDALLRIAVGVFLLPHAVTKYVNHENAVKLFWQSYGLHPTSVWVAIICFVLATCGVLIVVGRLVVPSIALTVVILNCGMILSVAKNGWLWNVGGIEYTVFWMIAATVVALKALVADTR